MSDIYTRMKKNRKNRAAKLKDKIPQKNSEGRENDGFWKLQRNKDDIGSAIVRLLPASEADIKHAGPDVDMDEVEPFVKRYSHGFIVNGKWFIHNCPRTIERDCPICQKEYEAVQQEGGFDLPQQHPARVRYTQRKGKPKYFVNILVISDPAAPENEGKVFVYEFGPSLFEKITAPLFPKFDDEEEMDPFCPWSGANFKLKIYKDGRGQYTYDKSEFMPPSPISEDDDEIIAVLKQSKPLYVFLDESKFKSSEKLIREYDRVVNGVTAAPSNADDAQFGGAENRDSGGDIPFETEKPADNKKAELAKRKAAALAKLAAEAETPKEKTAPAASTDDDEDDDDMSYFQNMLDED